MASELRPCPFCQKSDNLKVDPFYEPSFNGYYGFTVICDASGWDTASVDAVITLAKRVCDPAWIRIDEWYMGEDKPAVAAILPKPTPNETYGGKGANQAIALLIALLRAKEASK